ncbi:hypothetical protein Ancab_030033 [Ancistrocladus abbreviatus]
MHLSFLASQSAFTLLWAVTINTTRRSSFSSISSSVCISTHYSVLTGHCLKEDSSSFSQFTMGAQIRKEEEKKGDKEKKEDKAITVVLKVDLHCSGCISRVRKALFSFNGVEKVEVEAEKNKLTVVGTLDPVKLRDKLEKKTKKKVELISPQPKKEKDGGNAGQEKKDEGSEKNEKKQDLNKKANKEPPVVTVVLKLAWHCEGCAQKIHKIVSTFKGVRKMSLDKEKDLLTVNGTMDVKALVECLKEKLKRNVEIVPDKKDKIKEGVGGGNSGSSTEKKTDSGCRDKEEGGSDGSKAQLSRFEHVIGSRYGHSDVGSGYVADLFYEPRFFSDDNTNGCIIL